MCIKRKLRIMYQRLLYLNILKYQIMGPGLKKSRQAIFFSSSKGNRDTGIGLFVTRKAILKHGGTIKVDSSPNGGAEFRIALPRKPRTQN